MKLGVYISGKSSRLTKFILREEKKYVEQIKVVISDAKIEEELACLLKLNKISFVELDYNNLGKDKTEKSISLSNCIKKELDSYKIDFCFSFGSHILKGELLKIYRNKIINFHPSILPMCPGLYAIDQAIESKKAFVIGNTAHFIDEGIDTGPIIMQSILPIQAFYESNGNYDVVLDLQIEMMRKIIILLNDNRIIEENGNIIILGADYMASCLFPKV